MVLGSALPKMDFYKLAPLPEKAHPHLSRLVMDIVTA